MVVSEVLVTISKCLSYWSWPEFLNKDCFTVWTQQYGISEKVTKQSNCKCSSSPYRQSLIIPTESLGVWQTWKCRFIACWELIDCIASDSGFRALPPYIFTCYRTCKTHLLHCPVHKSTYQLLGIFFAMWSISFHMTASLLPSSCGFR